MILRYPSHASDHINAQNLGAQRPKGTGSPSFPKTPRLLPQHWHSSCWTGSDLPLGSCGFSGPPSAVNPRSLLAHTPGGLRAGPGVPATDMTTLELIGADALTISSIYPTTKNKRFRDLVTRQKGRNATVKKLQLKSDFW